MLKFNREIAERRDQIKLIIVEREKAGAAVSPDVFLTVSRSLVAAADARYEEARKIEGLNTQARLRLAGALQISPGVNSLGSRISVGLSAQLQT